MELQKARRDEFALMVSEEIKAFQGKVLSLSPLKVLTAINEILSRLAQCLASAPFGISPEAFGSAPSCFP
jgi:hypothetical protein